MPFCNQPYPTVDPTRTQYYFSSYWEVVYENEFFQLQKHKAAKFGFLGDWAQRSMRRKFGEQNTDAYRILVKLGEPWPTICTASTHYMSELYWAWIESIMLPLKDRVDSIPKENTRERICEIIEYIYGNDATQPPDFEKFEEEEERKAIEKARRHHHHHHHHHHSSSNEDHHELCSSSGLPLLKGYAVSTAWKPWLAPSDPKTS
jgi:hypothetical protein